MGLGIDCFNPSLFRNTLDAKMVKLISCVLLCGLVTTAMAACFFGGKSKVSEGNQSNNHSCIFVSVLVVFGHSILKLGRSGVSKTKLL